MSDDEANAIEMIGSLIAAQRKKTPWRRCTKEQDSGKCRWMHVFLTEYLDMGTTDKPGRAISRRLEICTCMDHPVVQQPRHMGVLKGVL